MTVLFVVATIIVFLTIDAIYRRFHHTASDLVPTAANSSPPLHYPRTPEGVFFARSHTWLNLFPSGKIRLGIDDLVSGILEMPEVGMLKHAGDHVRRGDALFTIGEGERTLTIKSPLDGKIVSVNEDLTNHPYLLKSAPFSNGWVYTLKPERLSDVKQFLLGSESKTWMQTELRRLRDFLATTFEVDGRLALNGVMMQDGGFPATGWLKSLDEKSAHQFQQEFLAIPER